MAESAGRQGKRGDDGPARRKQDRMKLEVASSMVESAGSTGKRGEDESARLNQDRMKLEVESGITESAARKGKGSEHGPARRKQGKIKLEVEAGMTEYAGKKGKRGEDEPARLNRDRMKLKVESSMAVPVSDNRGRGEDGPARLSQEERKLLRLKLMRSNRRKPKGGEDGLARLNQEMVKSRAESSIAERAGANLIDLEAESMYDVFLCFTASDNLFGFVDYLHCCLLADGIRVFRGLETLYNCEDVQLFVSRSRFYIPIFSTTYACSLWSLEALALMVEHASKLGGEKVILPVFYDVQPSDVKLETSLYRNALDTHMRILGTEKVDQWKKALLEAGTVKGWGRSSYKGEEELVQSIIREILPKLNIEHKHVPEDLLTGAKPLKIDREHRDLFSGAGQLRTVTENSVPEDKYTSAEPLKIGIQHEDLFTGAGPLKAKIEHHYVPEDLSTGAQPRKTDIKHEDLFTDPGPLKGDIKHNYVPKDVYTGADLLNTTGNRINVRTSHLEKDYTRVLFSGVMLSSRTLATRKWSLIRSAFMFLLLFRPRRIKKRVNRRWSLVRSVVGFLCFLFRQQRTRKRELGDSQVLQIISLLDTTENDVRIVGIHGIDGIGKTALAKIVYKQIFLHYDACSFLAEIEETMQHPGGFQCLQTKLIFDILKREYEVASAFKGVRFLKEIIKNMKVLLVLDGVEDVSVLKEFVGAELEWFGSGSRIIVTSKQRRVLQGFLDRGLANSYDVSLMDDNWAFDLFWQFAVGKSYKPHPYVEIANNIVKAAEGLPLLVKVFGSFLHGKGQEEWIKFRDLIQQFQGDNQKILRMIYEALDQKQKKIYLDIACFLPDVDCRIASYMWHDYDRPDDEVDVLYRMSLINMEENRIGMHSMLRCLARKIIYEGFYDHGTGVKFYIPAIAHDTKKRKKGKDHLNTIVAGFEILSSKTFLSLGRTNIGGRFADASLNVRWLHWQGCPRDFEAISIQLENLVILDLSWSKVTESWGGWIGIKMECLKVLNLTGCVDLLVSPCFSCYPKLEILILERCSRLVRLDPSINDLKHLVTLNLKFCSELGILPAEMDNMNALRELLIDGTSIQEFPASISKLFQLQILSAADCISLVRVPGSVCELKALSALVLDNSKIIELPESVGDLGQFRHLSLRDCRGLVKLPESIGELEDSLVELDISGTGISKLPDSTKKLRRLKLLKMDSCFIREFPCDIGELTDLEEVHASWCRNLEGVIPSGISKLDRLRELRLRGTRISSLPSEIQFMSSLQTLDLLDCDFLRELPPLPPSLINLIVNPDLKRN